MTKTDNNAHARAVLDATTYAVLATADDSGTPWATVLDQDADVDQRAPVPR